MIKKKFTLFFYLSLAMGLIVIISNYLVQFPVNYYGLKNVLTYGAFSYPITFLITDLANRAYGKKVARTIVIVGFVIGVFLTLLVSNFSDIISIRIAIGSGVAFLIAQNIDVQVFDKLRKNKIWYIAPLTSSILGSSIDTFLFFSISFYNSGIPWVTLAFGDLAVKFLISLTMLVPFKLLLFKIKDVSQRKIVENY